MGSVAGGAAASASLLPQTVHALPVASLCVHPALRAWLCVVCLHMWVVREFAGCRGPRHRPLCGLWSAADRRSVCVAVHVLWVSLVCAACCMHGSGDTTRPRREVTYGGHGAH